MADPDAADQQPADNGGYPGLQKDKDNHPELQREQGGSLGGGQPVWQPDHHALEPETGERADRDRGKGKEFLPVQEEEKGQTCAEMRDKSDKGDEASIAGSCVRRGTGKRKR